MLVATYAGLLLHLFDAVLDGFEVLYLQFSIDDFLVADRIDAAIDMHDAVVVEATQHVDDGIALTYVGQELVAQALALAGAFHEASYIDDIAHGRHDATRMDQFGQLGEPFVGHRDLPELCVDGAEGEVGCLRLRAGQTVEEG